MKQKIKEYLEIAITFLLVGFFLVIGIQLASLLIGLF